MIERYSREPMRSIFSDENRFKAYLEVKNSLNIMGL